MNALAVAATLVLALASQPAFTAPASASSAGPAAPTVPAAPAGEGAADTALRYQCLLIDGTTRLLIEDPRERHPGLAQECTLVRVALAPLLPRPSGDRPPWVGFAARLIENPNAAAQARLGDRWPAPGASRALSAQPMPADLATLVRAASSRHQLDPALVSALIYVESRYRPDARSPKGALGLMQLMPATAARYGVRTGAELLDPRVNVDVGVRHLRALHDRYEGRIDLMLAAYNAGEGAVERYGQRVPPYAETEDYVRRITSLVGVPENAFTP